MEKKTAVGGTHPQEHIQRQETARDQQKTKLEPLRQVSCAQELIIRDFTRLFQQALPTLLPPECSTNPGHSAPIAFSP